MSVTEPDTFEPDLYIQRYEDHLFRSGEEFERFE